MANRPHVPKFGNWEKQEDDGALYTMVFDNARKKKNSTATDMINPNDPTANPELFSDLGSPSRPPFRHPRPEAEKQIPRQRQEQVKSREEGALRQFAFSPAHSEKSDRVRPSPVVPVKNQRYGGQAAGNPTDPNRRPPLAPSAYNSNNQGSTATGGRTKPIQNLRNQEKKVLAVPQFGGWETSGADVGYTHIFDKVREERNQEGGKPATGTTHSTPSRPINHHRQSPPGSPSKNCCFPWSGKRKY